MPKLTYLLINTENNSQSLPLAVCGYSGKTYAQAMFDAKYGAHVHRVSQEEWEGGMGLDMAKNMHRRFQRWLVFAEAEADLESDAGKHAQEVDRLNARIAELEDNYIAVNKRHLLVLGQLAESTSTDAPEPAQTADESSADMGIPISGPAGNPIDLPPHPKSLEKLIAEENAKGANIQIEGARTTVKMRAALTEYYSQKAA